MLIATLIADPERKPLTIEEVKTALAVLTGKGIAVEMTKWLAEAEACDLYIGGGDPMEIEEIIRAIPDLALIDVVVQPSEGRMKRLLISDMDSTVIGQECIDELADFAGLKAHVSEITEKAMRGELDFESALRERVALLKGLPESVLQQCYDERIRFTRGADWLVATMRYHGAYCVLVSGGFTFFTTRVAQGLQFHEHHANTLLVEDGRLSGHVQEPILGKEAKLDRLKLIAAEQGIGLADCLAVGDGANDLPMLMAAGMGVAFHAKPKVQAQAKARINHANLRALLWMQGYEDTDVIYK